MPVAKEQMTDMPEWFDGKKINEVTNYSLSRSSPQLCQLVVRKWSKFERYSGMAWTQRYFYDIQYLHPPEL